jgi:hypothetical protein
MSSPVPWTSNAAYIMLPNLRPSEGKPENLSTTGADRRPAQRQPANPTGTVSLDTGKISVEGHDKSDWDRF